MNYDDDDVFMQHILEKQREGKALTHFEIELVRLRGVEGKVDALRSDIHELLEAWRTATGTLRFVKFVVKLATLVGGAVALFRYGGNPNGGGS